MVQSTQDPLAAAITRARRLDIARRNIQCPFRFLREMLNENGIELEGKVIILRRTLDAANKGKTFVNDVPVTI